MVKENRQQKKDKRLPFKWKTKHNFRRLLFKQLPALALPYANAFFMPFLQSDPNVILLHFFCTCIASSKVVYCITQKRERGYKNDDLVAATVISRIYQKE